MNHPPRRSLILVVRHSMKHLDLHAPILAGISAAGFTIGMRIDEICDLDKDCKVVEYYEGFNLIQAINENTGILRVKKFSSFVNETVYFGSNTVRLDFNTKGYLGCIYVFDGYKGGYGTVLIGSPLSLASAFEQLVYDGGDDMYYREDQFGDFLPGLAIVAPETDEKDYSNTVIEGFCIHNWSYFTTE